MDGAHSSGAVSLVAVSTAERCDARVTLPVVVPPGAVRETGRDLRIVALPLRPASGRFLSNSHRRP